MPIETQVLQVDPVHPDPELVKIAARQLQAGGLVAFPTETVYGLGANAFDTQAVARIFEAKRRPAADPLIVHIASITQLETIVSSIPDTARMLTAQFWPGPLTLILNRHACIPGNVSAGLDTVAVRMPSHPVAHALLLAAEVPVAAPSANLFTRPSPTTAQHVLDDLHGRIDLVVDGGPTTIGLESTVLSLVEDPPVILRPGGVSIEALQAILPTVTLNPRYLKSDDTQAAIVSPGMLLRHYAPNAEIQLFAGSLEPVLTRMQLVAQELTAVGRSVGVLVPDEERDIFSNIPVRVELLGSHGDLTQISANLFAGMRRLEGAGMEIILVHGFDHSGLGIAIWDRLLRAAEGRFIKVSEVSF